MNKKEYKELNKAIEKHLIEISKLIEKATIDLNATSASIDIKMLAFNEGMLHSKSIGLQFLKKDRLEIVNLLKLVQDEEDKLKPTEEVNTLFKEMNIKEMKEG